MVQAAKRKSCEFDCLLIDDTSRLARDVSDTLRTFKVLEFHEVAVVSVSQGIDSYNANARPLLVMHGIMDEQYLTDLAKKVHRGQEGRALHGYTTGGRLYGFRNVPIEDPARMGKYGRPAVLGVTREIRPEQAATLKRMFKMYAEGQGEGAIARQLNSEGIRGPNEQPWSRYTIHEMLRNESYRGVLVWGRTKKVRNPETGRKVSRATPSSEWRRVEVPKLRIIAEELWLAVEKRRKEAVENFHKKGGMTRTQRARSYLFSGILRCGQCGGSMVICAGSGKRGYVKYGCHSHKHNGVCGNKMMIRQDRLEEQLLAAIASRITNAGMLEGLIQRCESELKRRFAEMDRQGGRTTIDSLKKDLQDRKRRQANLIDAIEVGGDLSMLTERLRALENEIHSIQQAIARYRPIKLNESMVNIRDHIASAMLLASAMLRLKESLATSETDSVRAKEALAKHIGKLVLTPMIRDGRPVYAVSGNVSPAGAERCRMQWVARDGIEPPTPAFSGLDSPKVIRLKSRHLRASGCPKCPIYWDS